MQRILSLLKLPLKTVDISSYTKRVQGASAMKSL